jgi:hypothetical protein
MRMPQQQQQPVSPFPTIVLKHELPDGTTHFDWLLGVDPLGEKPLISFRTKERPDQITESRWNELEPRPDHRPEFLHIEGSLGDDRGVVTRMAKGKIFAWRDVSTIWNLMIEWEEGSVTEFEITTKGAVAYRIVLEDTIHEPLPSLETAFGGDVPVEGVGGPVGLTRKITAFGSSAKTTNDWERSPNANGTGATHVRTFHSKLTDDALVYVDQMINEWLDEHPEFEVKFVATTIGTFTGKIKEPHLICQVWV